MTILAAVQNSLVNFSAVKIGTTDIFIFAGIILAAIGAIWGIRKMIALGYLSSVPGHWQKRYEREQDLADYKEFRDEGGFELGTRLGSFGGKTWYFGGLPDKSVLGDDEEYDQWAANYEPSSHVDDEDNWYESPEDDLGDGYIGSVGGKSWYYDKDGMVYSNFDEDGEPYVDYYGNLYSGSGELVKDIFIFDSYESRESYRDQLMDYIDYKQEFASDDEYIAWRNQENDSIDSAQYYGADGEIHVGHPDDVDEEEDLNIGWDK